jgi:exodeoxyribonuclease V alpha subunit
MRQSTDPPADPSETRFIARLIGDSARAVSADGWCWWNMKNERTGERGRISGHLQRCEPGELLDVTGRWEERRRPGGDTYWSFKVESYSNALPVNREGMVSWIRENLTGVGETFAKAVVDHVSPPDGPFDPDALIAAIDDDPSIFGEVKTPSGRGLSGDRLQLVMDEWTLKKRDRRLGMFFRTHDISPKMSHKLYEAYGEDVLKVLTENPYKISELRGIGFLKADEIAQKMGVTKRDPKRIQAGLLYVLEKGEDAGHTYLRLTQLYDLAAQHLFHYKKGHGLPPSEEQLVAQQAAQLVQRKRVVVEREPAKDGAKGEQRVFRYWTYRLERQLAERLRWLAENGRVHEATPLGARPTEGSFIPTNEQWQAVQMVYTHRLSILTGLPGTGKTATTKEVLRGFASAGKQIMLAAPTGKAARRLTELTGHPAMTIHRLLKWSPQNGAFLHDAENPIEADLIIVDEASMLSLELANHFFQAVGPDTHVLLVGDVNQLPPIGAGKVLDDLIESKAVPTTALTQIFRQAQSSMIIVNAHRINSGEAPYIDHEIAQRREGRVMDRDFHWVDAQEADQIARECVDWAAVRLPNMTGGKLDPMRDIMILVPKKDGRAGLVNINLLMQKRLNPKGESVGVKMFRIGDRILQTVNDYNAEIMNGELAIIESHDRERAEVTLVLDDGERTETIPKANLESFILGYAMSIHKSQGSQFKAVVMPVCYEYYVMLSRSLYYTALTRAEKFVVGIGERRALREAINNKGSRLRNSALAERIRDPKRSGALF